MNSKFTANGNAQMVNIGMTVMKNVKKERVVLNKMIREALKLKSVHFMMMVHKSA